MLLRVFGVCARSRFGIKKKDSKIRIFIKLNLMRFKHQKNLERLEFVIFYFLNIKSLNIQIYFGVVQRFWPS